MYKRRIISLILVLCLLIIPTQIALATDIQDVDAKAQALNKLGLLSGDGKGNYNLSSSLKRSEAAAFIIKLMGKSNYILQNKNQYINTGFSDVKSTDWYASYVGYCKENMIITGIGQNKFGPSNNVTEKAFLAMVMKVLGYTNDDFGWSSVYQKAFEIGLVTDQLYKDKIDDNRDYTRAEVIKVMYKALTLKVKNNETTLIKKLLLDGAVQPQQATDAGFISDEVPSNITQVSTLGEQWITVKFNEPVRPISESNILIYERDSKAALGLKIVEQTDTEIKLKTDSQKPSTEYILKVSNVMDTEDNVIKEIVSGFKGYTNQERVSDFFEISKVEQKSGNEIEVYFTHPININAEQPEFYSILQKENVLIEGNKSTLSVKAVEGKTNAVLINSKDFIYQQDVEYTIKIKGSLISAYGTNLGLEGGDKKSFIAKTMKTENFQLVGITALSTRTVQLDFNKQVHKTTAEQVFSYYITEYTLGTPIQIVRATTSQNQYGQDCAVVLTLASDLDSKKGYSIMINNVSDAAKQNKIEEQKFSFNVTVPQTGTDIKITSVLPIDLNCVKITFDRSIDQKSAETISNYTILCLNNTSYNVNPVKAVYSSSDPKSVKLYISYLKPMIASYMYRLSIANTFQDFTGTKMTYPFEYNFIANNVVKARPEITKAAFIAKDTIKINFNRDIALDVPNIMTNNYYIQVVGDDSTKKMPLAINYIDNNTVVLKFDKIDFNYQYYLRYYKLIDITGEEYSGDQLNTAIVQGE